MTDSFLQSIQMHAQWAWFFVFVIAFLESMAVIGLVMPGWVLLVGIGTLIGAGGLDFYSVVMAAYIGAVLGEYFSYYLGFHYHETILKWKFVAKHQKLIETAQVFFQKHGASGVFIGRFIGPLRAVIPFIAGIAEMPKKTFIWVNITSGLIWAPFYLIPGILIGAAYNLDSNVSNSLILFCALLAVLLWYALKQTRRLFIMVNNNGDEGGNATFAGVNVILSWSILGVVLTILVKSDYYPVIRDILSIVVTRISQ